DNTVAIETSGFLGGSGSARLCRSRVASILGLPADAVFLLKDPSPVDFDSGPSSHGRNASVILDLVESACGLIQKKRFRTPLPISVTKTTAPPRKNRWNDEHFEGNPFPRFSYGACVVEVELDPVDYLLKVRHVWMIIDSGPITDQKMAETTLRGGILATLLSCYGPRILKRMPGITVMFHKNSKIQLSSSLHELPSLLVPSALISSISQASGSFFDTLPLSTELIHKYTGTS
ncbi:MAG: molybdopterin-dependent oxidoreductase, partial [Spirochaetales bacterium]|nr:molybdopterin-dependent oxidoreductase [Spirochaetales bacterium]